MDAVRQAAKAKRDAEQAYRDAIVRAKADGHSAPAIAEAAGVTRSAVYQVLDGERKRRGPDEAAMTARLAELDGRWDALVREVSEAFMPANPRAEQAVRNAHNGKARRALSGRKRDGSLSGHVSRKRRVIPTVRDEARALAEAKILRMLEHKPDEPLVQRIVAEIDEAYALREKLAALRDTRVFGSPV